MNCQSRDSHLSPLLKSNHILKLENKILIEHILFINKSFSNLLLPIFNSWLTYCFDVHNYQTVSSSSDKIFKPSYKTDSYGKNSITVGAINCWNKTQHQLSNLALKTYSTNKITLYALFLKNALKTVNKEVKEINLIKQIKSVIIYSPIS